MLALIAITPWHWIAFIACVIVFLALDLGLFHRKAHVVGFKEALIWTAVWFTLAMVFALGIRHVGTPKDSLEFVTGYLIELSLSMDNVFVIALIFGYFRIPAENQHRVLFWGILGALITRHKSFTGSSVAANILDNWATYLPKFKKVMPVEYRRALAELEKEQARLQVAHGLLAVLQRRERRLGVRTESATGLGQPRPTAQAIEQGGAQLLFEQAEAAADRGLRAVQSCTGASEAAEFGDGDERSQAVDVH